MAIASDVDDTSTGSSGNPVENEDTNMLADSSGSNQIDCTVHHYYEKLKDFAFDMPGGWTDATISLFIDTFKLYKDDFSRPHSDELKIWQKIVKRCVERSNNHKVFTVNSVMELAGSLKSHVLRNEYRKDDETFKMLYNDVVDIIPYFPNTTCDSVSQNLRLRSRTQEVKTYAKVTEPPPKVANIDNLILKYCEEMNLKNEHYCCNSNWNNISIRILKNHDIRVDVKKHLAEMKRKVHKELKGETDPNKKREKFYEAVGQFRPYFDLIPPRTIKTEDFDKDCHNLPSPSPVNAEASTDEQTSTPDVQEEEEEPPPVVDGPRVYRKATPRRNRPGNSTLDSFPRIRKILGITDNSYSSESDDPDSRKRSHSKTSTKDQDEEVLTDSANYSGASDETGDTDVESREEVSKPPPSKKKGVVEVQSISSRTYKGKIQKSCDEEVSPTKNTRVLKRPAPTAPKITRSSALNAQSKNPRVNERSSAAAVKTIQNQVYKNQAKMELTQMKVGSSAVSLNGQNGKKVQKGHVGVSSRSRRVNAEPTCQAAGEKSAGNADGDLQPEARSAAPISSNCLERMKSKNIVTPINVKVSEMQQEASTSAACSERFPNRSEGNVIQQRSAAVAQDFNRLERLEENTIRIIEGYKEKVKETGHNVMQLIPKQHIAIPPVGVSANSSSESEFAVQPINSSKPPAWFDTFFADYKKHEMWKMHQILKMQQELVDMENRKLTVLDKILTNISDRKS